MPIVANEFLPMMDERKLKLFWEKVDKNGENGCWNWVGKSTKQGYGVWQITVVAHRLSWEIERGKVPEGLVLDHLCRNPSCVNPDHLEPVTIRENIRRGYNQVSVAMRKTTCAKGHPLVLKHHPSRDMRGCTICATQRMRGVRLNRKLRAGMASLFGEGLV